MDVDFKWATKMFSKFNIGFTSISSVMHVSVFGVPIYPIYQTFTDARFSLKTNLHDDEKLIILDVKT